MPSINQVKQTCLEQMRFSPKVTPLLHGAPGSGKSDVALQIGAELGYTPDRILVVHINNYEVIDFTGVPSVQNGYTDFNPTKMFYEFREGTGGGLIVFEEIAQSTHHHQTFLAGFELERQTAQYKLDPAVRMICTANRAQDRSGAKPLLAHLNDRLWHYDVETSLDDWCEWAMSNGVDPYGIAFLRLRSPLLNAFDPASRASPTQRSWTKLFTQIPRDMPTDRYLMACEAKVGEGAAAEWVAAKDMMDRMPDIDAIRLSPTTVETPVEAPIMYAVATSMSMTATLDTWPIDMLYITRMRKEFQMLYAQDVMRTHPEVVETETFGTWARKHNDIFTGV